MPMKVVIAGATGLVGSELLKLMLDDPDVHEVVSLVRRPSAVVHTKLGEEKVDFDLLENHRTVITGDAVFCCLGTTIKKAGTRDNFKRVDFQYPLHLARIAKENGIPQYNLISSMGADSRSRIFYSRVKGEVEEAITQLKLPNFNIFRPSLLIGHRTEQRAGEKAAIWLSAVVNPLLIGGLRKYRGIKAGDVAMAMLKYAKYTTEGVNILTSDKIFDIAKKVTDMEGKRQ